MSAVVLVGLLLVVFLVVGVLVEAGHDRTAARKHQLLRDLRRADAELEREHRKARQAMNDAAGQGWRNPFE